MATTRGRKGQTAKVFFGVSFTDGTGLAVDPTGTPQLRVYQVAEPLVLKATLTLTKQAAITGFWGAFLDISNGTTYPAGDYQVLATPTVSGIATVLTDTFEIDDAATLPDSGVLAGAYCSEAQVRAWTKAVAGVADISSGLIAEKAAWAAREIDASLRGLYAVPFAGPPYDDLVVLLNIWLAVANALEQEQGSRGNTNDLGTNLRSRVFEKLADLLSGEAVLSAALLATTIPDAVSSTEDQVRVFDRFDSSSPLSRY